MQIHVAAIGTRLPAWATAAHDDYHKRMPPTLRWHLHEIAASRRGKHADVARILRTEGEALLGSLPAQCRIIALDRKGREIDTEAMARAMDAWMHGGRDVAILIGGPEGLSPEVLATADECWSLSVLTMAHPVVRVVLAEQLYRAHSILARLPYHRGD